MILDESHASLQVHAIIGRCYLVRADRTVFERLDGSSHALLTTPPSQLTYYISRYYCFTDGKECWYLGMTCIKGFSRHPASLPNPLWSKSILVVSSELGRGLRESSGKTECHQGA